MKLHDVRSLEMRDIVVIPDVIPKLCCRDRCQIRCVLLRYAGAVWRQVLLRTV